MRIARQSPYAVATAPVMAARVLAGASAAVRRPPFTVATAPAPAVAAALAALALLYRLIIVATSLSTVDSDQAVLGIMARHILHGDRPIFFYGQSYQGALEAYLTAGVFHLWGQSDLTLRLVPILISVLLVAQLYGLARRLYGSRVALVTGLWLALPAPALAYWGTFAGAGYIEVMALGTGMVIIAVRRWGLGRPRRYDLPALGLLTGLGVWIQPVIVYYVAALAVAGAPVVWRRRLWLPRAAGRRAWPALACFTLGAAPWLGYTLFSGGASLGVLSGHVAPASLSGAVGRLFSETLPVLMGGALPFTLADGFAGYVNSHALAYVLTLPALGYLAVRLLVSPGGLPAQVRALVAGRPLADAPLALLPFVAVALYLTSRFEALPWTTHNPRYLLPLYTSTPYFVACALPVQTKAAAWLRGRRRRALAALIAAASPRLHHVVDLYREGLRTLNGSALTLVLGVALLLNVYGSAHYQAPQRVTSLAAALLARGDGAVYCQYWLAWQLAFESSERLIPVVTRGLAIDPQSNTNRYPPYLEHAAYTSRWAYILPYDVGVPALVALLKRHHALYTWWRWGNASIFDGPRRPDFPPVAVLPSAAVPPASAAAGPPAQ